MPARHHLLPYCPEKYRREFDEYCAQARVYAEKMRNVVNDGRARDKQNPTLRELGLEGTAECIECEGHWDPHVRLAHRDSSGVSAEVVFAGGQNFEELPFRPRRLGRAGRVGRRAGLLPDAHRAAGARFRPRELRAQRDEIKAKYPRLLAGLSRSI